MKRRWIDIFDSVLTVIAATVMVGVILYAAFVWWNAW